MFLLPSSSLRELPNNLGLNHTIRSEHFWANANYFLLILIIYASAMKPRGITFYKLLKLPTLEPVCYATTLSFYKNTSRFTVSGWTWLRRLLKDLFQSLSSEMFLREVSYFLSLDQPISRVWILLVCERLLKQNVSSFKTKCTIRKHWKTHLILIIKMHTIPKHK